MVDEAIDGSGGGHGIFEDPVPLAEGQVAGDEQRATLVAFGHEGEEHLDLIGALLDVSDVIQNQELEGIKALQGTWQAEIAFGGEQILDEPESRREQDGVTAARQGVSEGGGGVGLSASGQSEAEDVGGALEELSSRELVEFGEDGAWKSTPLERFGRSCQGAIANT